MIPSSVDSAALETENYEISKIRLHPGWKAAGTNTFFLRRLHQFGRS